MIKRLLAYLRLNLARNRLAAMSSWPTQGRSWISSRIEFDDLQAVAERAGPLLQTYERLAPLYDSYAACWCNRYEAYLFAMADWRGQPMRRVLDLACGGGPLVRRLAPRCERVVGIDASESMLDVARRSCHWFANVELVQADFRSFALREKFDAVVCASDALNYVGSMAELEDVFRCVAEHLAPGGLFAFDVLGETFMRTLSGKYTHYDSPDGHFVLGFNYDSFAQRERTDVIFPDGIEQHHRIPIDRSDVLPAAAKSGLWLVDEFRGVTMRSFYLLEQLRPVARSSTD